MQTSNNEFRSYNEWNKFCYYLLRENRYVLNERWKEFIATILNTAKKREHILKKDTLLLRARIGSYEEECKDKKGNIDFYYGPLPQKEMGAPPFNKAKEGRINPKGISYLYLANNLDTAIAEIRPWLKQSVSVGYYALVKNLKFVDTFRDKHGVFVCFEGREPKLSPEKKESLVWGDINYSFSIPVRPNEEHNNYIPTQYISECLKNQGYDGIIYKSSLVDKGYNIVLFDPNNACLKHARLFDIKTIKYEYEESANPYWVK